MKKTLTAICATILVAAPIQITSAAAKTTEENTVQQNTNCQTVNQYKWSNQDQDQWLEKNLWSNLKWHINLPQPSAPSKEAQANKEVQANKEAQANKEVQANKEAQANKETQANKEVQANKETQANKEVQANKESQANNNTQTTQKDNTASAPSTTTSDVSAFEQEVVKLTNAERTKAGLTPFKTDDQLMAAAREKSQDMQSKNYFSHTSPTFGSPFDRMKALGISYKSAGENIAQGQRSPQEVVQAWMDSPGHRANILNEKFTHIGVGYVKSGNYWTQQFIQK